MNEELLKPGYVFETSWEVCNKVGGIHTVISTKARTMVNEWHDRVIMIGPDIWKGVGEHPEFAEDSNLLSSWRTYAESSGLKIKIGRWKITGNPIAILIDFTPFFTQKNEIFGDLWAKYKVDSLMGQWDYIEPALFGYAAGKVIETFYHHQLTLSDKIIAQFHEWMTGVGLLYLHEHVPQVGTVFTTHATVVGRALAGNGLPLYSQFDSFNGDSEARTYNCTAKHSLEKMTATYADCFTTVSEITARECEHFLGKKPDFITPNGFENFIVPDPFFFKEKRGIARKRMLQIASILTGEELPSDTMLVLKSGRYEFHNKGIDVFIDALRELNNNPDLTRTIAAFIFVPAAHTGPVKDLREALENPLHRLAHPEVLTHYLQGADTDSILACIYKNRLENLPTSKVKVIFAPIYLDGYDGVFNLSYYDLITGIDISAFPSYYEPWGYTPLESLAFQIPTITTNLTGFGMVIHPGTVNIDHGIAVIERNDKNEQEACTAIASILLEYSQKKLAEVTAAREAAGKLSQNALWKNLISEYKKAYSLAIAKAENRASLFYHSGIITSGASSISPGEFQKPAWRKLFVQSTLPASLHNLELLVQNLWWTWNHEAITLFEMIDEALWWQCGRNPILLLNTLSLSRIQELRKNQTFLSKVDNVYQKFEQYMKRAIRDERQVAYFCMEYGLDSNLKIYSGGLGILAGDYLKEASDQCKNIVGVGLLYRQGYFRQNISSHGEQQDINDPHSFTSLPLSAVYDSEGNWQMVALAFPGRTLYAKVWKVLVGCVSLFLLDTDISENRDEDRLITAQLYGGNIENRIRQELLLGIGGVRMLQLLGYKPSIYHYNEGHAAFAGIELIRMLIQDENLSFAEAFEVVRSSTLFTTHTAVPAGHDAFSEDLMRTYLAQYANIFNVNWKELMALGLSPQKSHDKFSMSNLAIRLSQEVNAVSVLHENVSRKIFNDLYEAYSSTELNIGHVTNGIHFPTWISPQWQRMYDEVLGIDISQRQENPDMWKGIYKAADSAVWNIHNTLKLELLREVIEKLRQDNSMDYRIRERILNKLSSLNEKTLVFGFARRFVSYKRALLIFYNLDRLLSIINSAGCPVLFLFAGKAHPQDDEGKEIIKRIIEISQMPEFEGKVIFLHNYNIVLAKQLTRSVDVWLNTPELNMEASGTSGMKAAMNGVLNLSISDGWWAEAYQEGLGWSFGSPGQNMPDLQYEEDAYSLYQTIEDKVIPLFIDRNQAGIPQQWVTMIKRAITQFGPKFSMNRVWDEYDQNFYRKIYDAGSNMRQDNFRNAKQLARWKSMINEHWANVQVLSATVYDSANRPLPLGDELAPQLILDTNGLTAADIGVEIIFSDTKAKSGSFGETVFSKQLEPSNSDGNRVTYSCKILMNKAGVYQYIFRVYPKNPLLLYRQHFPLYKWG